MANPTSNKVYSLVNNELTSVDLITMFMLVLTIIAESWLVLTLVEFEMRHKFAFRLLLHCPGSVIVANSNIDALFVGNFDEDVIDATMRDADFYQVIVKGLPDATITGDLQGKIITANQSCECMFGVKQDSLVGTTLHELGRSFKTQNCFSIFQTKGEVYMSSEFEKIVPFTSDDGSELQVSITMTT